MSQVNPADINKFEPYTLAIPELVNTNFENLRVAHNDTDSKLSPASTVKLGLVQVGTGLTVDTNGVLSTSQVVGQDTAKISFFAMSEAPSGYLKANGAAISRTTYASLYSIIGTSYGAGDGSTTFNIPDLRGVFLRGLDDGRGLDINRVLGSLQMDDLKNHRHYMSLQNYPSWNSITQNQVGGFNATSDYPTSYTGGTETRPVNVALLACIKY